MAMNNKRFHQLLDQERWLLRDAVNIWFGIEPSTGKNRAPVDTTASMHVQEMYIHAKREASNDRLITLHKPGFNDDAWVVRPSTFIEWASKNGYSDQFKLLKMIMPVNTKTNYTKPVMEKALERRDNGQMLKEYIDELHWLINWCEQGHGKKLTFITMRKAYPKKTFVNYLNLLQK